MASKNSLDLSRLLTARPTWEMPDVNLLAEFMMMVLGVGKFAEVVDAIFVRRLVCVDRTLMPFFEGRTNIAPAGRTKKRKYIDGSLMCRWSLFFEVHMDPAQAGEDIKFKTSRHAARVLGATT